MRPDLHLLRRGLSGNAHDRRRFLRALRRLPRVTSGYGPDGCLDRLEQLTGEPAERAIDKPTLSRAFRARVITENELASYLKHGRFYEDERDDAAIAARVRAQGPQGDENRDAP